jgi:cell division protein FtsN
VAAEPAPARKAIAAAPPPAREAAPKAAASVVTASTTGYVAVLSSQKSRMDALKAFADLQQKYGDVLSSKTPDVQEANLGDKGVWYRAVVGPPVSRDAASGICSQLKAAGYAGCWVTAY